VDDEELNRELLEGLVEVLGYCSQTASNGAEALSILLPSQHGDSEYSKLHPLPDLVLLDAMMPGIDGFEVVQRVRADETVGQIPIIMVTALTSKEDRLRAVTAGANDFITKPIDRTELRVRISSLLRMKEAQDAVKRQNIQLRDANAELRQAQTAIIEDRERLTRIVENQRRCDYDFGCAGPHCVGQCRYRAHCRRTAPRNSATHTR
jgi:putative two-component system response regulator